MVAQGADISIDCFDPALRADEMLLNGRGEAILAQYFRPVPSFRLEPARPPRPAELLPPLSAPVRARPVR